MEKNHKNHRENMNKDLGELRAAIKRETAFMGELRKKHKNITNEIKECI